MRDFRFGDLVIGTDRVGQPVRGKVVGIDYDPTDKPTTIAVKDDQGNTHDAEPASLRYVVSKEGFAFEFDGDVLSIHRNDSKMRDPLWWRDAGIKKLAKALRNSVDPPGGQV